MMPSGFLRVFGLEVVVVGDDGAGLDLAGLHAVGDGPGDDNPAGVQVVDVVHNSMLR